MEALDRMNREKPLTVGHAVEGIARVIGGLPNYSDLIRTGEVMNPHQIELVNGWQTSVIGKVDFGEGKINPDVSEDEFKSTLHFLANSGVATLDQINQALEYSGQGSIKSILSLFGSCMDGRENDVTLGGKQVVIARPKLVGGPTVFIVNVGSIVGDLRFEGQDNMLERVKIEAAIDPKTNGAHLNCGMATSNRSVLVKYHDQFDAINELGSELSRGVLIVPSNTRDRLRRNTAETIEAMEKQSATYTEEGIVEVIRRFSGDDAIMKFKVDPNHPTGSHEEAGIVFLFSKQPLIMIKDAVSKVRVPDVFYQNVGYSIALIERSMKGQEREKIELAKVVGIHLPLAANAVLGKNQWVGVLGSPTLALAS